MLAYYTSSVIIISLLWRFSSGLLLILTLMEITFPSRVHEILKILKPFQVTFGIIEVGQWSLKLQVNTSDSSLFCYTELCYFLINHVHRSHLGVSKDYSVLLDLGSSKLSQNHIVLKSSNYPSSVIITSLLFIFSASRLYFFLLRISI